MTSTILLDAAAVAYDDQEAVYIVRMEPMGMGTNAPVIPVIQDGSSFSSDYWVNSTAIRRSIAGGSRC